ncbi:MAG: efflux RND transporter periplasmic adaptor subunit [Gammaproteobacteria bacterium]
MMKNRKPCWKFSALDVIAAVVLLGGCSPKTDSEPPAAAAVSNVTLTPEQRRNIRLYTIVEATFHKSVDTIGAVDFDNDQATSVLAPFSGPVARLLVSPGDQVKKGEPLAAVDSPDFAAAISTYYKALATAKTNRHLADLDKDLVQHNGVAQREAAQAETDAVNAEADRDAALQALTSLGVPTEVIKDIQEGRPVSHAAGMIRSPISGTVVEKLITPGQLLQAGTTPCFTVADLSRVWVMAQVFGSDLGSVSLGDPAEVISDADPHALVGRVDNISAMVSPDTRSVAVRVVVDNPARLLKKQMYVRVQIQSRRESIGLLIPVSAILRDDQNLPFVYLAQPGGGFARQHVTLGYRSKEQYDIASGLKAGDQIVVEGGIFVQFMQNQ